MNTKRRPGARKSRIKTKKPKFLSLSLQFPAIVTGKSKCLSEMLPTATADSNDNQLNLFPLHPENQVEVDRENHDHENADYFFSSIDGGATSLNSLLDATTANSSHATNNISSSNFRPDNLSPSSRSLMYAYGEQENESGAAFVRNAMRNRERDSNEEKWVFYSEVVERKVKEEEVSSSAVDIRASEIKRLSLKLDYQEILNAWSDKGPLYIHGESSQIVPDINDDIFSHEASNNGCSAGLWAVPKMVGDIKNGEIRMNNGDELKTGQRLASLLRYKQKRQNRLFSKKIRYEVRKLNAQKRPRLKGRFVKRS